MNPEIAQNYSPQYLRAYTDGYSDAMSFIRDMIKDGADLSDIEEWVGAPSWYPNRGDGFDGF